MFPRNLCHNIWYYFHSRHVALNSLALILEVQNFASGYENALNKNIVCFVVTLYGQTLFCCHPLRSVPNENFRMPNIGIKELLLLILCSTVGVKMYWERLWQGYMLSRFSSIIYLRAQVNVLRWCRNKNLYLSPRLQERSWWMVKCFVHSGSWLSTLKKRCLLDSRSNFSAVLVIYSSKLPPKIVSRNPNQWVQNTLGKICPLICFPDWEGVDPNKPRLRITKICSVYVVFATYFFN